MEKGHIPHQEHLSAVVGALKLYTCLLKLDNSYKLSLLKKVFVNFVIDSPIIFKVLKLIS